MLLLLMDRAHHRFGAISEPDTTSVSVVEHGVGVDEIWGALSLRRGRSFDRVLVGGRQFRPRRGGSVTQDGADQRQSRPTPAPKARVKKEEHRRKSPGRADQDMQPGRSFLAGP